MIEEKSILDTYLKYIKNTKNYSKGTVDGYELDLKIFFNFILEYKKINIPVEKLTIFSIQQIRYDDIIAYMVFLNYHRMNCSNTRQRKLAAIKSFFRWICFNYKIKNPSENLPSIQSLKRIPKYLNLEQAKRIQNVFSKENCKNYIRNNAMLTLFLTTGIRLSELIKINLSDIDFTNNTINIVCKGNKDRIIYISSYCKEKLLEYKKIRDHLNCLDDAFFLSSQKKRLSKGLVEYISKKAYSLIGVSDRHYTVHTLRHTAATIFFEYNNRDLLLLKELLGHSTILATEVYLHTYNDMVREAVNKNPLSEYGIERRK